MNDVEVGMPGGAAGVAVLALTHMTPAGELARAVGHDTFRYRTEPYWVGMMRISTRRFCARPYSLRLSAMGRVIP